MSRNLGSTGLKSVDKLVITFLVDNSLEWFGKLPPGFTSEVRNHLAEHKPEIDPRTGVPFLDLDNYCCGAHGFSALIETQETSSSPTHLTLFDTGPDRFSLVRNMKSMQTPVDKIERVILSHWHRDHSGGILSLLDLRNEFSIPNSTNTSEPCVFDLHPDRPITRGIAPPPDAKVICRLPEDPTFEEIEEKKGKVEKHKEGHAVSGGTVWVSGEIPRVTEFEGGLLGGVRWVSEGGKEKWVPEEHIMDERYAAIDVVGKGLIMFSACSHAGIVNVVKDAVKTFERPIYMIIGGLHLGGPELVPRIKPTVQFLCKDLIPSPTYVLPMHCSGFKTKIALEAELGEGCVPAGVGNKVVVVGDEAAEHRLMKSSWK